MAEHSGAYDYGFTPIELVVNGWTGKPSGWMKDMTLWWGEEDETDETPEWMMPKPWPRELAAAMGIENDG